MDQRSGPLARGGSRTDLPQECVGEKKTIVPRLVHAPVGIQVPDEVHGERYHQGLAPLAQGPNRRPSFRRSR